MARIFITGSTQGIGAFTAKSLIESGHEVVLHARNDKRADEAQAQFEGAAAILTGELTSLEQTRTLAKAANAAGPYEAIIHNAGIGGGQAQPVITADGLEQIFQINVVAPYVLTALMPAAARMIYLTSGLEADGLWTPNDLQWQAREWAGMQAYSDSKLHLSMLAFEIAARFTDSAVNVVDPGWIKTRMGGPQAPDPLELGAQTQLWLATASDASALETGRYLKRLEELEPNPVVRDASARAQLVAELERLTGIALPS